MYGMLRFSGAVKRDPAIDVWLNEQAPELGAIAQRWFVRIRAPNRSVSAPESPASNQRPWRGGRDPVTVCYTWELPQPHLIHEPGWPVT
jgi:hypothetical protein